MTHDTTAIERALDADDLPGAAMLAERALAAGATDPLVFNLAAWRKEDAGAFEEAEEIARRGLAMAPRDAALHLALGSALRSMGRLKEAVAALDNAIEQDPGYAAAWYERGATFEKGGSIDDAIADYRHTLSLDRENAPAMSALAAALTRRGELAEALTLAKAALALDPRNMQARNALALVALEEKRFDDAIAILESAINDDDRREALIAARTHLGDAYEGVGRYDDAFASYSAAQSLFDATHRALLAEGQDDAQLMVEKIATSFARADAACWSDTAAPPSPPATHVFLTGYPRSGTTLTENILATLPRTIAIEERPTLAGIDRAYLADPDGLGRLSRLSTEELAPLRSDYWMRAERAAGAPLDDTLFVDMDPFKGSRLPLIAKLFPTAKVVIMRRDPRDVVWSCFHTNFAYNSGTMAFSSLESTARHYSATWSVIEAALATLPIDHFNLRYDSLVRDFDRTTKALCDFLNVTWSEDLRRFDRTAQRRGVGTASVSQVRRGLYDGSGGWRRYEKQLAAVEPILAPWIARFEIDACV